MNPDQTCKSAYTSELHARYIIKHWLNDNLLITAGFFSKSAERFKFASDHIITWCRAWSYSHNYHSNQLGLQKIHICMYRLCITEAMYNYTSWFTVQITQVRASSPMCMLNSIVLYTPYMCACSITVSCEGTCIGLLQCKHVIMGLHERGSYSASDTIGYICLSVLPTTKILTMRHMQPASIVWLTI